jgi:DNA polymerase (family X)
VRHGTPPATFPSLYQRLLDIGAINAEEIAVLRDHLGLATLPDLLVATDDGRVTRALSEARASELVTAAAAIARETRPLTLGRAFDLLDTVRHLVQQTCSTVTDLVASGEVRRFEPLVSSLVLVGRATDPEDAVDRLCAASWAESVAFRSARRALVTVQNAEVDVRLAAADEYGTVLFMTTGSRDHIKNVTGRRGFRALAATEEELYAQAGLDWIPPELRHDSDSLEAAAHRRLPRLLERADIRGDLHMHTTYSDGQDTLETMVAACASLGYEYIAITDHSENAGASRTVSVDQLARQRDEIGRLRERYPRLAILHGIEVDILQNGRLDCPDEVLEGLDVVLASLHDAARHDGATLTGRCLEAIRHSLVNVITHPSNQLVGRRSGYELDYPAIYEAALETGTALEIDGAPSHLDLDGEHARAAAAIGVTLTIDSDCHRARSLGRQMEFGIGTARRGWVEAAHVLNARPLDGVQAFIRAKRQR